MTTVNVVESKLRSIDEYYSILLKYRKYSQDELKNDITLKGALERYLYLLCQAAIDLGEAVVSIKGFYSPTSYSDIFQILQEKEIITPAMAQKLIKMTGFRNAIIHDYRKFNFDIAYSVLMAGSEDIKEFESVIKKHFNL
jgi:uncharacterized protein YutE (UPF0331/DUF86 family)